MTKSSYKIVYAIIALIITSMFAGYIYAEKLSARTFHSGSHAYCQGLDLAKELPLQVNICKMSKIAMSEGSPYTEAKILMFKLAFFSSLSLSAFLAGLVLYREKT